MSEVKVVLHWLENSRSQRILWLLEELELPYEIVEYKRNAVTMFAGPELKAIHALGKSPVITIVSEGKTITLPESGAICEYLIERFGSTKTLAPKPTEHVNRANYLYWIHFAEGTTMLPLMLTIIIYTKTTSFTCYFFAHHEVWNSVFNRIKKGAPWFAAPIVNGIVEKVMAGYVNPKLVANFTWVESHLEGKLFLGGDHLTGADIMMVYPAEGLEAALGFENYPLVKAWVARCKETESWKRAEAKGGPASLEAFMK